MASCADTTTTFGGLIALQNLINAGTPPPSIMSIGEPSTRFEISCVIARELPMRADYVGICPVQRPTVRCAFSFRRGAGAVGKIDLVEIGFHREMWSAFAARAASA